MDMTDNTKPSAWHPLSLGVTQEDIEALQSAKKAVRICKRKKKFYTFEIKGCIIQTTNPQKFEIYYGKKLV